MSSSSSTSSIPTTSTSSSATTTSLTTTSTTTITTTTTTSTSLTTTTLSPSPSATTSLTLNTSPTPSPSPTTVSTAAPQPTTSVAPTTSNPSSSSTTTSSPSPSGSTIPPIGYPPFGPSNPTIVTPSNAASLNFPNSLKALLGAGGAVILLLLIIAILASYIRKRRDIKRHSQTFGAIFPPGALDETRLPPLKWYDLAGQYKRWERRRKGLALDGELGPPPSLIRNSYLDSRLSGGMMEGGIGAHGHGVGVLGGTLGRRPSSSMSTLPRNGSVVSFHDGTLPRVGSVNGGVAVTPVLVPSVLKEDLRDVGLSLGDPAYGPYAAYGMSPHAYGGYGLYAGFDDTIPLSTLPPQGYTYQVPVCEGQPSGMNLVASTNGPDLGPSPVPLVTPPTPELKPTSGDDASGTETSGSLYPNPTSQHSPSFRPAPSPYLTPYQPSHSPTMLSYQQSRDPYAPFLTPPQQAYHMAVPGMTHMSLPRAVSPLDYYGVSGNAYVVGPGDRSGVVGEGTGPSKSPSGVVGNVGSTKVPDH
ncbi:hypothetical protein HDV00_003278 [Rhizophlyctis rosea]|nr:hypothetical protein HDV00_003278 [Rhizophlyctis rosea]